MPEPRHTPTPLLLLAKTPLRRAIYEKEQRSAAMSKTDIIIAMR